MSGLLRYPTLTLSIVIIIALAVILHEQIKQYGINKIFNFRKELKHIKRKKFNKRSTALNSTLIGRTIKKKKPVYTPDNAKHIFICGTTGSGKTVALSNYLKSGIEKGYSLVTIDGKGGTGEGSIYDIIKRSKGKRKLYTINLTNPLKSDFYNPFKNASPTVAKDMLINLTDWSEEHYKLNTERYLQRLLQLMVQNNIQLSFKSIIQNMSADKFADLSSSLLQKELISKTEHLDNMQISKTSGKIADNAAARFSLIAESELGYIFNETGIDIYQAIEENAIILFILNPLIFPEMSPLIARLILIDGKKALSQLFGENRNRIFFIMDEINSYASPTLIDLINKSRSANVTCILATQSLSDLDYAVNSAFKEQVIENCNNYIVMRQNSSVNAEHWANI